MLACAGFRAAFRSCSRPLNFVSTSTRTYHPFHSSSVVRHPARRTRLWYRRDGTPRSKREGAIYVALALTVLLPYCASREVYTEYGAIYDLIHTRRICWYSQYDFSKPNELVEFFCKVAQMDLDPSISQEKIAIAKFVLVCTLEDSPEVYSSIRRQLEELRESIGTHDAHRIGLENAQVAGEMVMNVTYDWLGKAYKAHGLWNIEEGYRKPDAKNMYHEIG